MFTFAGRQREQGLGAYPEISLAKARALAAECRSLLDRGLDPIDAKKAATEAKKAQDSRPAFGQCATEYFATKRHGWRFPIRTRGNGFASWKPIACLFGICRSMKWTRRRSWPS
jgi:hypothetical protein